MEQVKQYKSETVLFFAATAIASALAELTGSSEFKAALGDNATLIIFGMSIAGYLLRKYTTKPLEPVIKKKEPPNHKDRLDMLDPENQADDNFTSHL
jgi:hypothetical protein